MSEQSNGHDSPSRLDRLEKIVEVLPKGQIEIQETQRVLLRAQALMSADIRALTDRMRTRSEETDEKFKALAEAKAALLRTVDQFIRRLPGA